MMAGDKRRSDGPTTPVRVRVPPCRLVGQTNSRKNKITERPSSWGFESMWLLNTKAGTRTYFTHAPRPLFASCEQCTVEPVDNWLGSLSPAVSLGISLVKKMRRSHLAACQSFVEFTSPVATTEGDAEITEDRFVRLLGKFQNWNEGCRRWGLSSRYWRSDISLLIIHYLSDGCSACRQHVWIRNYIG